MIIGKHNGELFMLTTRVPVMRSISRAQGLEASFTRLGHYYINLSDDYLRDMHSATIPSNITDNPNIANTKDSTAIGLEITVDGVINAIYSHEDVRAGKKIITYYRVFVSNLNWTNDNFIFDRALNCFALRELHDIDQLCANQLIDLLCNDVLSRIGDIRKNISITTVSVSNFQLALKQYYDTGAQPDAFIFNHRKTESSNITELDLADLKPLTYDIFQHCTPAESD